MAFSYASVTLVAGVFIGILGYLAFGDQTASVILSNMPETETIGVIARVSYLFAILGCWVIVLQPIFYVVESSLYYEKMGDFTFWQMEMTELEEGDNETREQWESWKYYLTRTTIVGFIVLTSFVLPSNLNLCLSIAGAVLGFIVTILIPVTFYNKALEITEAEADAGQKGETTKGKFVKYMNRFVVCLASALAIAGLG